MLPSAPRVVSSHTDDTDATDRHGGTDGQPGRSAPLRPRLRRRDSADRDRPAPTAIRRCVRSLHRDHGRARGGPGRGDVRRRAAGRRVRRPLRRAPRDARCRRAARRRRARPGRPGLWLAPRGAAHLRDRLRDRLDHRRRVARVERRCGGGRLAPAGGDRHKRRDRGRRRAGVRRAPRCTGRARAPFVVAGIAAAGLTIVLARRSSDETRVASQSPALAGSLSTVARAGRGLTGGALALAISGATNAVVQLLVPLQMHDAGASTESIGLAFSCAAGLYIAVSAAIVRLGRRAVTSRTNALAALVLAVALFPAGSSGTAVAVLMTMMLTVAPRATLATIAYPLATSEAARAGVGQGTAVGLLNGAWAGAMVAAPFAAGAISHWAGVRAAWLTTLALAALGAAWLLACETRPGVTAA